MSLINLPKVPNVPGVPLLKRAAGSSLGALVLGAAQGALWRALSINTQWGIFDKKGKPIANLEKFSGFVGALLGAFGGTTQSTVSIDYSKEAKTSDFPVEKGSFAQYNKVEAPAAPTVTLSLQGSESDRKKFLAALDAAVKSTDLFSVVTPEVTYANYAIERYNYSRSAQRGLTLLTVQVFLKEVRQVSSQYTKSAATNPAPAPKSPAAASAKSGGKVQAAAPKQSVLLQTAKKVGVA